MPIYQCGNASGLDKIGVICRGASLGKIGEYKKHFTYSFLVGQHEESLKIIGKHLKKSKLIQVTGGIIFKTNPLVCEKYNIIDMQVAMDPTLSQRKAHKFKRNRKKNRWLKVHPLPSAFKSRNNRFRSKRKVSESPGAYPTTGLFGVDLAASFEPKNIHIIGLDFYCSSYFARERFQVSASKNRGRTAEMIEFFKLLCKTEKDINFHLYTCCNTIKSKENLHIIRI